MTKPFYWSIVILNLIAILVSAALFYVIHRSAGASYLQAPHAQTKHQSADQTSQPTSVLPDVGRSVFADGTVLRSSVLLVDKALSLILSFAASNIMLLWLGAWRYNRHKHASTVA